MSTPLARWIGGAQHLAGLVRAVAEAGKVGVAAADTRWRELVPTAAVPARSDTPVRPARAPARAASDGRPGSVSLPVAPAIVRVSADRPARRPLRRLHHAAPRLVLGVSAVGLALAAQDLLQRQAFTAEAFFLLLAAGLLFVPAAAGVLAPHSEPDPLPAARRRSRRRTGAGALLLGGSLLLNGYGLTLFGAVFPLGGRQPSTISPLTPNLAWITFLASIAVAVVGAWMLDGRPDRPRAHQDSRLPLLALLAVLCIAAAVRLYRLGELPFGLWFDEAYNGLQILKILADPAHRPVFVAAGEQGQPVMYWYVTIPFFWLFGPTQLALRVPTALAGVAGVAAVFLLGRALFGNLVGLAAAALLATMSWHVTLSRIGFNAAYSVALDAAALALLVFGLRQGRWTLFALSGLCLGLGQHFYYTSRLVVPVILLYLLHRLVAGRMTFLRQHAAGLALAAGFAILTSTPLALFSLQRPTDFYARVAVASVGVEIRERGSYQPLVDNVWKHLAMFNVRGDRNGRHNLPGAPMLERTTAVLAALGLALAVRRSTRPEYFVLVAWWLCMLLGGVLSLAYEAPQSLRTADEVVAVALLAALPLVVLAEQAARLAGRLRLGSARHSLPLRPVAAIGIVSVGVIAAGAENLDRYFVRQAHDFGAWSAHSTAATLIGRAIAEGTTVGRVYLGQTFVSQPSIELLAPGYRPHVRLDAASSLPLRDADGATLFLSPDEEDRASARRVQRCSTWSASLPTWWPVPRACRRAIGPETRPRGSRRPSSGFPTWTRSARQHRCLTPTTGNGMARSRCARSAATRSGSRLHRASRCASTRGRSRAAGVKVPTCCWRKATMP
jgi:hypothetical protein